MLAPRSSMSKETPLVFRTHDGVIDADYRGEVKAIPIIPAIRRILIQRGDRLVQGVLVPAH